MFRILKDKGPLLKWRTYQALCSAAGVNENTFNKNIRESAIIVRQAAGIYRIIGAHVPSSLVEALVTEGRQRTNTEGPGRPEVERCELLPA
jgi:hypothetical protein